MEKFLTRCSEQLPSAKEKESFILSDAEVLELARWAVIIEEEYGMAMDMEWARDGENDKIYIVQARPETVQSQKSKGSLEQYHLNKSAKVFLTGTAVGNGIGNGPARILKTMADSSRFKDGDVLVAEMTDPDWVPLMKKASAIVTEHGGSTSHAAIVSRELGVPAVLGVKNATKKIKDGNDITVSCAEEGEGRVFHGLLDYEVTKINLDELPKTTTQVMINVSTPGGALKWWNLPVEGIGLTRLEFLINNEIKIHPMALVHPELVEDKKDQQLIKQMLAGYENYEHYFVERLGMGIAKIAASQYSQPVIIRMSDFKTNEYSKLIGGKNFEPHEENPMLGFRGASRYYHPKYREGFSLECQAFKYAREVIGLDNIIIMIPFCRTPEEADLILETMAENGLIRGDKGLKIYMMAEVPSNIFLAKEFAQRFDGFSIGSNDLTQLILGVDRDSDLLQELFSANHPAVRKAISALISDAHEEGVKVGICGQEPSDNPDFAKFLVECGIDSISLNPDSVFKLKQEISSFEQR